MEIRNCKYNHLGTIDCEINHPEFGWIPFTADPNDIEPIGKEVYDQAIAGEVAPYVEPVIPDEILALKIRGERDKLLRETDWTQLADVPQATKDLWDDYRQALRDVPQQEGFPQQIIWPEKPV